MKYLGLAMSAALVTASTPSVAQTNIAGAIVPAKFDLHNVPVEYGVVSSIDVRVPVSASVRAATWDALTNKPSASSHVRLACIVWTHSGAVGACVAASLVPAGQATIDWGQLRAADKAAERSAKSVAASLNYVAAQRIHTALLTARRDSPIIFVVRFFDEVVAPADAREPFSPGETVMLRDVTLKRPLDGTLLADLYPNIAVRKTIKAHITVSCLIEPSLELLCRDPGSIQLNPAEIGSDTDEVVKDFRFSAYQLVSTLQPEALDKAGHSVVGKLLRVTVAFSM
ncbi:hypothetical protein [Novosphingobium pituita]|uniref:Uncharacterized protein n=1 Tax=Novosphingobium pituita TaxID=3056842 RepID=A0ABQ6P750_9SPHN|nr:hypothetical protein [Novosphingobium sp. IK01]GMM60900.1 hypothetical protein NUTIK01_16770 [Novosphingobium sp. IK01]